MSDRPAIDWLWDARRYALQAYNLVRGMDEDEFGRSNRDQCAVQFCLIVVGEALNAVPKDMQALAPGMPWRAIYNLRNRLIHSFWLIDTRMVLDIAQNKTSPLVSQIDGLIEELEQ
jgi:uncharacterized protein with HEPN domain